MPNSCDDHATPCVPMHERHEVPSPGKQSIAIRWCCKVASNTQRICAAAYRTLPPRRLSDCTNPNPSRSRRESEREIEGR
eukprot:6482686-Amphidinium_carterae.2